MKTFIRAVEYWVPGNDRHLLEFGGGLYGTASRFGAASPSLCFARGEGLPGRAWEAGHPIVLKQFDETNFRRTRAAQEDGLTCGIALPIFAGEFLTSVLVIFCGDDDAHAGAIELWCNDPAESKDMTLVDGHYGTTGEAFEYISRRTSFRRGHGLPGQAWDSGLPVFIEDLGHSQRFLRADSARQVGINRGVAMPCAALGPQHYVLAFLSALNTPIARRLEIWQPDAARERLLLTAGFCERDGTLGGGPDVPALARGEGSIGQTWLTGMPAIGTDVGSEAGSGPAAAAAAARSMVAIPILSGGRLQAAVALYF